MNWWMNHVLLELSGQRVPEMTPHRAQCGLRAARRVSWRPTLACGEALKISEAGRSSAAHKAPVQIYREAEKSERRTDVPCNSCRTPPAASSREGASRASTTGTRHNSKALDVHRSAVITPECGRLACRRIQSARAMLNAKFPLDSPESKFQTLSPAVRTCRLNFTARSSPSDAPRHLVRTQITVRYPVLVKILRTHARDCLFTYIVRDVRTISQRAGAVAHFTQSALAERTRWVYLMMAWGCLRYMRIAQFEGCVVAHTSAMVPSAVQQAPSVRVTIHTGIHQFRSVQSAVWYLLQLWPRRLFIKSAMSFRAREPRIALFGYWTPAKATGKHLTSLLGARLATHSPRGCTSVASWFHCSSRLGSLNPALAWTLRKQSKS
jgi:hypothetical protein